MRTLKRDVCSWCVERKLHRSVWRGDVCMEAGIWTSLVVDEEGIFGLGEWDCSLTLFVSVCIPNHLRRGALDDTVGWAYGIGVAIRGAESGDGKASRGLYKVGKVPSKGNWVVCCNFIVGGGCRLWWLSEGEHPRRQRVCYRCLRYTGCTGSHFSPSLLFLRNYTSRRRMGGRNQDECLEEPT